MFLNFNDTRLKQMEEIACVQTIAATMSTRLTEGNDRLSQFISHNDHFQPTADDVYTDCLQPPWCHKNLQKAIENKSDRIQYIDDSECSYDKGTVNKYVSLHELNLNVNSI